MADIADASTSPTTGDAARSTNRLSSYGEPLEVPDPEHASLHSIHNEPDLEAPAVPPAGNGGLDPSKDDFDLLAWILKRRSVFEKANFVVPEVSMVYKNLSVQGNPSVPTYISTVITPFLKMVDFRSKYNKVTGNSLPKPTNRQILHPMDAYCKPGEMTLVIGRPGAGCSTLLRTLAGITTGLKAVDGEITFNGIPAQEFKEKYASCLAYSPEDDPHYATITVRQTLRFALECRVGGSIDQRRRRAVIEELIEVVLRVLGLRGCGDTKVGSAMVRGCSGGERKRVSIAEQMLIGASIGIWDGSTKGLDSSSSLDFIRALRTMTNVSRRGNILSLYQASQDMYDLFDKVILLANGRCLYFGPAGQAKSYFENLGFHCPQRKVTPDFLTGITEIFERELKKDYSGPLLTTPKEFEDAYRSSEMYRRMTAEGEKLRQTLREKDEGSNFQKRIVTNKEVVGRSGLSESIYTTTAWQQLKACVKREFHLARGNVALIGRLIFDTVMAVVVGSTFFNLPQDVSGAFSRGGVLYFSVLFMALTALAAVPLVFAGRSVAAKHRSYALYRTHFQPLAMQLVDMPVSFFMIIVWSVIVYFMAGLRLDAGAFFSYVVFILATSQAMGGIVRTVASLTPNLNMATQLNGMLILLFIIYSGYIIPHGSMHPWFVWIYWLNPIAYGIKALLENEFAGVIYQCGHAYIGYPGSAGACAVKGGRANSITFDGSDYLVATYQMELNWKWLNFAILMAFWIGFLLILVYAGKFVDYSPAGYSINMYKKRKNAELQESTRDLNDNAANNNEKDEISSAEDHDGNGKGVKLSQAEDFTWKHIDYSVKVKGGPRQLLTDVSGFVRPGTMTALMGSSGAGKTTLIDAITQRKTIGELKGQIYVGKAPQGDDFKNITAYCEQLDVHNPFCTVREALRFSAILRQPKEISLEEKHEFVERVIRLLELKPIADAVIGQSLTGIGLSMEQRKRVTIAVELVARPKIIFLDEPTSGLDSQAAFTIVRLLRALAKSGQAVVCTIHQPSALLFEMFDRFLLLARGGKTVYCGELGANCATLIEYFERHGAPQCPPTANVAEYILDSIGAGTNPNVTQDWPALWTASPEYRKLLTDIDEIRGADDARAVPVGQSHNTTKSAEAGVHYQPFSKQLSMVWRRMTLSYFRNPSYNLGRIYFHIFAALIIGFSFFNLTTSVTDLQNRTFAIFMALLIGGLQMNMVQPSYLDQRLFFLRESSSGFYDWKAFAISITTAELPYSTMATTVFFVIFYFTTGLNSASDRAGYFYLIIVIYNWFTISLGQMVAAMAPTVQAAAAINPFFMTMQMLFCGVTIRYADMPVFWKSWLYWIDPMHYFIEGVITNELQGVPIECAADEVATFAAPLGTTCAAYLARFSTYAPGKLLQSAYQGGREMCRYCTYKIGDEFLDGLGWGGVDRWRDVGLLAAFWAFNIIVVAVLASKYKGGR